MKVNGDIFQKFSLKGQSPNMKKIMSRSVCGAESNGESSRCMR